MDNKYFEDLANSINEPNENKKSNTKSMATLTVKVDIDAKIYCDGDFLDLVEANVVKKIPIETGQHLITIESENVEGVSEDREVDVKEAGKNYLLIVKDMLVMIQAQNNQAEGGRLINQICSVRGLNALIVAASPIPFFGHEHPYNFERYEDNDHDTLGMVDDLLKGRSILVFQIPPIIDEKFESAGTRIMAKNVSYWNSIDKLECRLFILSLNQIKKGLLQLLEKEYDNAVSWMNGFIDKIPIYNVMEWERDEETDTGIPLTVSRLLESALMQCDKNEAELYIKNH